MKEEEPKDPEAVLVIKQENQDSPYRRPFLIVVGVIAFSLLAQGLATLVLFDVARDTNKVVKDVQTRNSPETQAAQAAAIENIIFRVDCNSRAAIEDALNQISDSNPGLSFTIDILQEECRVLVQGAPNE